MIDKKTVEDLFYILEPNVDMNTGNSGDGLYGNYCEWKNLNDYDDETLKNLLEYFLDKLPKEKKYSERKDIITFLRTQGVPEKTAYEFEKNFPFSQGYFNVDESDYLYKQYGIEYIKYVEEVESLKNLIKCQSDPLTIKALLFAVFSLTESYMKQVIWDMVPSIEENIKNDFFKKILKKHIVGSLKYMDKTVGLSKELGLNIKQLPHNDLRNVLAHNIGVPSVIDLNIIYTQKDENENTQDIMEVIAELLKYAKDIKV